MISNKRNSWSDEIMEIPIMDEGLRVLIVDDEKMIRDAVSIYLTKMGCVTFQADNGQEALRIYEEENVEFIILDLMLPGMTGEEVCRRIRMNSEVPIIMLTAKTQENNIIDGLQIGADDYVTKPFSVKELYARIEAVMRRLSYIRSKKEDVLSYEGGLIIDLNTSEVRKREDVLNLTKSEWKILSSMVVYPKKVFTRDELMVIVFGEDAESLDRAIDTHIKNLRKKIEDDPKKPVYIKTVHGFGYKFGGEKLT